MTDATITTKTLRERALAARTEQEARNREIAVRNRDDTRARIETGLRDDIKRYLGVTDGITIIIPNDIWELAYATIDELPGIQIEQAPSPYSSGVQLKLPFDIPDGLAYAEWWMNPANQKMSQAPSALVGNLAELGSFLKLVEEFGDIEPIQPWPEKPEAPAVATDQPRFAELSVIDANRETRPFNVLGVVWDDNELAAVMVVEYIDGAPGFQKMYGTMSQYLWTPSPDIHEEIGSVAGQSIMETLEDVFSAQDKAPAKAD